MIAGGTYVVDCEDNGGGEVWSDVEGEGENAETAAEGGGLTTRASKVSVVNKLDKTNTHARATGTSRYSEKDSSSTSVFTATFSRARSVTKLRSGGEADGEKDGRGWERDETAGRDDEEGEENKDMPTPPKSVKANKEEAAVGAEPEEEDTTAEDGEGVEEENDEAEETEPDVVAEAATRRSWR